jgi:hypothetical protein
MAMLYCAFRARLFDGASIVASPERIDFDPDHEIRTSPRDSGDDFFCLRYRVWYPSHDCAFRTHHRTSAGCLDCDQGRFNLKRHADAVRQAKLSFVSLG